MKAFLDFAKAFQLALRALQLYSPGHPRYVEGMRAIATALRLAVGESGRLQVTAANGRLLVGSEMADKTSVHVATLLRQMEERNVYGLVFTREATAEELGALLGIFALKPARVAELGGVGKLLEEKGVRNVSLTTTRFEEIGADDELVSLKGAAALAGQALAAGVTLAAGALDRDQALSLVRSALSGLAYQGLGPADLGALAGVYGELAGSAPEAIDELHEALGSAVRERVPAEQVALLRGIRQAPPGPARDALAALVPALGPRSLAAAYAGGAADRETFVQAVDDLLQVSPEPRRVVAEVQRRLREEGLGDEELGELLEVLTWADKTVSDRVARILEGNRIFEMPREWVLAFLRELLETSQFEDFRRVLQHYVSGLQGPLVGRRRAVADGLTQVAGWVKLYRVPGAVLDDLVAAVEFHYARERDPDVHAATAQTLGALFGLWLDYADYRRVEQEAASLGSQLAGSGELPGWKRDATRRLLHGLATAPRLEALAAALWQKDREAAAAEIHPVLRLLGEPAFRFVVEKLAEEEDRSRRGRLVEALKAAGPAAIPALRDSLKAPEWFVVRNALNVLGEIGVSGVGRDVESVLGHDDARVRRAAVRALWKLTGPAAEPHLVERLGDDDPETQIEALFGLGELGAAGAVAAVAELVRPGNWLKPTAEQAKVRERAVEVLGKIGAPEAVPVLADLLGRKGFLGGQEPLDLRVAAARALRVIGTPEARAAVDRAVADPRSGLGPALKA